MIISRSYLTILIIIIIICCGDSRQIKKKPDNENNWELCPICKGYGTINILKNGKSADDVTDNPGNKFCLEFGFCLFPLLIIDGQSNDSDLDSKDKLKPEYSISDMEKNYSIMKDNVPERSTVKKKTKCPSCNGKGWIINNIKSSVIIKDNIQIIEKNGKIEYKEKD